MRNGILGIVENVSGFVGEGALLCLTEPALGCFLLGGLLCSLLGLLAVGDGAMEILEVSSGLVDQILFSVVDEFLCGRGSLVSSVLSIVDGFQDRRGSTDDGILCDMENIDRIASEGALLLAKLEPRLGSRLRTAGDILIVLFGALGEILLSVADRFLSNRSGFVGGFLRIVDRFGSSLVSSILLIVEVLRCRGSSLVCGVLNE